MVARSTALRQARVHDIRDYPTGSKYESLGLLLVRSVTGDTELLARYKSEVDEFLLNPDLQALVRLRNEVVYLKREEIDRQLEYQGKEFADRLLVLDKPYQLEKRRAAQEARRRKAEENRLAAEKRHLEKVEAKKRLQSAAKQADQIIERLENN